MFFFFSSRRRHTRSYGDWSSDVCSSDLGTHRNHQVGSNDLAQERQQVVRRFPGSHRLLDRGQERRGRSEERRVGKSVDLGGRRIIKKKTKKNITHRQDGYHEAAVMSSPV